MLMPDAPSNDPNTCSYSGLIALDERRAMAIYSDSRFPNAQGQLCKTILSRVIEVAGRAQCAASLDLGGVAIRSGRSPGTKG